jgi:hypothetical protein
MANGKAPAILDVFNDDSDDKTFQLGQASRVRVIVSGFDDAVSVTLYPSSNGITWAPGTTFQIPVSSGSEAVTTPQTPSGDPIENGDIVVEVLDGNSAHEIPPKTFTGIRYYR